MRHLNNFGAMRLLFAILVILSHSPELIDGNRSRELLTQLFGTLSFGEIAVDGFFLISGFLITKSYEQSPPQYLRKRVLRIYPGYVVAYLFCVLALGPFVGGHSGGSFLANLGNIVLLQPPQMDGVFAGTPYPVLNGSMWTIAYEFRCYLVVLFAGQLGLLSYRFGLAVAVVCAFFLASLDVEIWKWYPGWLAPFSGDPHHILQFAATFGCGALFYLYRDLIIYNWKLVIAAALLLSAFMFSPMAVMAFSMLGGYLIFWLCLGVKSATLSQIGQKIDLSYGIYLYAYPIQKTLLWFHVPTGPSQLFAETLVLSSIFAFFSWHMIEKPFLGLKHHRLPKPLGGV